MPNLALFPAGAGINGIGDSLLQLGLDFTIGLLLAALYLRTVNLFLVIGIHTLINAPTMVVASPIGGSVIVLVLALGMVMSTFVPGLPGRFDASRDGGRRHGHLDGPPGTIMRSCANSHLLRGGAGRSHSGRGSSVGSW